MKKKATAVVFMVVIALGVGIYLWQRGGVSPMTKEEAIKQAQSYSSGDRVCTQAITPAVHKATGARFTFNTGCIPPGWESERQ